MSGSPPPELTIVVPAYNERETIREILARVRELPISSEVIVVDNCSTDGTREILQGLPLPRDSRSPSPATTAAGTSVRTGFERARGEFVVCQDADLEYDPQDIPRLLEVARGARTPCSAPD